jgi:hypothetical protein
MHRLGVGCRVHGNRRDAEFLAGTQDPERDLAAIGYENFIEHVIRRWWRIANSEW